MTRIKIDRELREKLLYLNTPLELCNEAGQVVARVIPSNPWTEPDKWEELTPPISEEELRRRMTSDEPTISTSELLEQLRRQ